MELFVAERNLQTDALFGVVERKWLTYWTSCSFRCSCRCTIVSPFSAYLIQQLFFMTRFYSMFRLTILYWPKRSGPNQTNMQTLNYFLIFLPFKKLKYWNWSWTHQIRAPSYLVPMNNAQKCKQGKVITMIPTVSHLMEIRIITFWNVEQSCKT